MNFEYVSSNKFVYQIFPQFWCYLQSIDSETQEDFDHALDVLLIEVLLQFLFVLDDDGFGKELTAFQLPFVNDDFVVLAQLDLVVFNRLSNIFVFRHLLEAVEQLQYVDAY